MGRITVNNLNGNGSVGSAAVPYYDHHSREGTAMDNEYIIPDPIPNSIDNLVPPPPDEHCLMRSPRGMIVAVRIAATDAILNLARRGWTFVESDEQEVQEVQR